MVFVIQSNGIIHPNPPFFFANSYVTPLIHCVTVLIIVYYIKNSNKDGIYRAVRFILYNSFSNQADYFISSDSK